MVEIDAKVFEDMLRKNQAGWSATADVLGELNNGFGEVTKLLKKQEDRYTEEEMARKKAEEDAKMTEMNKARDMAETAKWAAMEKTFNEAMTKSVESIKASLEPMVKSVVHSVVGELQGLDVNAADAHKVSGGNKWPMNTRTQVEDKEEPANLRHETSEVQKPIQAMHDGTVHDEAPVVKPEGVNEYPVTEKEGVPPTKDDIEKMISNAVEKALLNMQKSQDATVNSKVETLLKKAGYREERGLAAPKGSNLGLNEVPIAKSGDLDFDKMTLRELASGYAELIGLNNLTLNR